MTTAPESRLEWILTAGVLLGLAGVMLTWMVAHLGKIAAGVSAIAHRLGDKSELPRVRFVPTLARLT